MILVFCAFEDKCVHVFLHVPGLHIIYTQDEVDVVQNLMFYIEAAYKVAVSHLSSIFVDVLQLLPLFSVPVTFSVRSYPGLWDVGERRQNQPGHH